MRLNIAVVSIFNRWQMTEGSDQIDLVEGGYLMEGCENAFEARIKVRIDRVHTRGVRHTGAFTLAAQIRICALVAIVTRGLIRGMRAVLTDITMVVRTHIAIFTEGVIRKVRTSHPFRTYIFRARDAVVTCRVVGAMNTADDRITAIGRTGMTIITARVRAYRLTTHSEVACVVSAGILIVT